MPRLRVQLRTLHKIENNSFAETMEDWLKFLACHLHSATKFEYKFRTC